MRERPPEQKALFDRVLKLLDASKAQTPGTVDDVAELSDLDASLALVMQLCADIDYATKHPRTYCGHCRVPGDAEAGRFETVEEVQAHLVQCPHSPLVRAVWTALNALTAISAAKLVVPFTTDGGAARDHIEQQANVAIEALARMVGR